MNAVQELLERDAGPMPVGGWVLLLGGAGVAAYMIRQRDTTRTATVVEQVPVPVGAIAAPDGAPSFTTVVQHTNVPALDALLKAIQEQTEATKENSKIKREVPQPIPAPVTPAPVTPAPTPAPSPALPSIPYPGVATMYGQVNDRVAMIQQRLNAKAGAGLAVDRRFGPLTLAAVKSYQRAKGLLVDGIVGPQTWGSLFS